MLLTFLLPSEFNKQYTLSSPLNVISTFVASHAFLLERAQGEYKNYKATAVCFLLREYYLLKIA